MTAPLALVRDVRRAAVLFAVAALAATPVRAQQSVGDALAFLITTQAVDTGDASRDRAAAQATNDTLARSLVASLAVLPLTSSSGGFAYRFNPALGTVERATDSFGPLFVERAMTSGAGRLSVAATWQFAAFKHLDGMPIEDGAMVTTSNRFRDETQPFDLETLRLRVSANSITFTAAYGVTDRLDIGTAVPLVSLSLEGDRTDTYRGTQFQQASASASVARLGDVLVRGKYHLVRARWGGVAAGGDLRLPTGPSADLLGAGELGAREFAVLSLGTGAVSAHANLGFNQGGVSSGVDLAGAVTAAVTPRLTLSGELLWRQLTDIGRITPALASHPTIPDVETLRLVPSGGTTSAVTVVGMKWNIGATWLLRANVLIPLTDAGLTATVVPSVAFEYSR